jgi:hypothetical protein
LLQKNGKNLSHKNPSISVIFEDMTLTSKLIFDLEDYLTLSEFDLDMSHSFGINRGQMLTFDLKYLGI